MLIAAAGATLGAMAGGRAGRSSKNKKAAAGRGFATPPAAAATATHAERYAARMEDLLLRSLHVQEIWERLSPDVPAFDAVTRSAEVRPSTIEGLGLFARVEMAENAVASFYPIHALGSGSGDGGVCLTSGDANNAYFGADEKSAPYRATPSHRTLSTSAWPDDLWIDANPNLEDKPGWLAHRANDAAFMTAGHPAQADILAYYSQCREAANCVLVPFGAAAPVMCLWTLRPVAAGEELLQIYGHDYWVTRQGGGRVPPMSEAVLAAVKGCGWKQAVRSAVSDHQPARYAEEVELMETILAGS